MRPKVEFQRAGVTFVRPSSDLAQYVSGYTVFDLRHSPRASLALPYFPGGNVSVWIHFGKSPFIENQNGRTPLGGIVDLPKHAKKYVFLDDTHSIHIEFRPAGAVAFFNRPLSEFTDQMVPLEDVWLAWVVQALHDIAPMPLQQQILHIESLLWKCFNIRWELQPRVQAGVAIIRRQWGRVTINKLANELNLSQSQLERTFMTQLGMTPKQFARTQRFLGTVLHINQQPQGSLAELAVAHGYADQAHFVREFKEFAAQTPTQFAHKVKDADFLQDTWTPYK